MTKKVTAKYLKVIGPVFITKPEFAAYLSKHLTKRYPRFAPGECPLARASGCVVTTTDYCLRDAGKLTPLPKWAQKFVTRIDAGDLNPKANITGKEALAILKKIK